MSLGFLASVEQRPGNLRDIGQLHRALDQRMARQNLLEQGRTGPRQADYEYGIRVRGAIVLTIGKELRCEQRLYAPHMLAHLIGLVRQLSVPQLISLRVMLK